jgi:two-component SAPR family response regulator
MPIALVESADFRGKVALVPVDDKRMLVDYAHPIAGKHFMEVRAFGKGQVWVNARPVEHWEGFLPRALFFFFVDRAMTTRDDIFRVFWPKLEVHDATNVFHVTKRKINQILGVDLTIYSAGFYRIAPDLELYYDVVNFQEAVQAAEVADEEEEAMELYQIALDLYREDFLNGMNAEWMRRRRDEMLSTYTEALVGLARIHERRNELDKSLGLYLRAAASAPLREDLVRGIMRFYHTLGQADRALDSYEHLREGLQKTLNMPPDPQTTELADKIRAARKK